MKSRVVQLVEYRALNPEITGSIPVSAVFLCFFKKKSQIVVKILIFVRIYNRR